MKEKVFLMTIALLGVLFLSGCSSSYEDCKRDCSFGYHRDEICTDSTNWWDGCTDEERAKLKKVCYNECSAGTKTPTDVPPEEPVETVIIEINSQEIDVYCHSYLDYEPYERIDFNGTLNVWLGDGQDYIKSGSRMIIYPDLDVFLYLEYPKNILPDETGCHMNSLHYNITISGKTVSDSIRVDVEDCENYYNCGVIGQIMDKIGGS